MQVAAANIVVIVIIVAAVTIAVVIVPIADIGWCLCCPALSSFYHAVWSLPVACLVAGIFAAHPSLG
jgi:hypothetical protein